MIPSFKENRKKKNTGEDVYCIVILLSWTFSKWIGWYAWKYPTRNPIKEKISDGNAGNYSVRVSNGTKELQLLMQCCFLVLSGNHIGFSLSFPLWSLWLSFSLICFAFCYKLAELCGLFKRGDELSILYDLLLSSHMMYCLSFFTRKYIIDSNWTYGNALSYLSFLTLPLCLELK